MGEVIDVGRQHESIHHPGPARLRDDRSLCVACQQLPHVDGSDFCDGCRAQLSGGWAVLHRPVVADGSVSCCCGWSTSCDRSDAATAYAAHLRQEMGQ